MSDLNEELVMDEAAAIADNILDGITRKSNLREIEACINKEIDKVKEVLSQNETLFERFRRRIRIRVLRGVLRSYVQ